MGNRYIPTPDGELYHWGIKGMKWGQRRWQNKDGSLTPAGKKRYAKEEMSLKERERYIKGREKAAARQAKLDAKKAELDAREKALDGGEAPKKGKRGLDSNSKGKTAETPQRSMKDMSDDELREMTNRMTLEKNYLDAQKNLASVTPKQVSAGKKFMDKYGDQLISSIVVEPTKKYITKALEKKLGLEDKDPLAKLERQWKKADYEKKIAEAKRDAEKAKTPPKDSPSLDEIVEKWSSLDEDGRKKYADAARVASDAKTILEALRKEEEKKK